MKHNLRTTLLFSLLFFTSQLFAQSHEIRGMVTSSEDGIPLAGVNALVQGTTNGTQTDFDGNYVIKASQGDVLTFSFLGLIKKNVTVGSDSVIKVQLAEDAQALGEVVVTALGIKKTRKSLTYSTKDIKANGVANAVTLLGASDDAGTRLWWDTGGTNF